MGTIDQGQARFQIVRALADGLTELESEPRVQALLTRVHKYHYLLAAYGVRDHQVARMLHTQPEYAALLGWRLMLVAAASVFCIPGLILASPCVIVTRAVSQHKAAAALRGSTVKIEAKDVVATWKVMIGLIFVPVLHLIYTGVAWLWAGEQVVTVYFFFMPFISAFSIRMVEDFYALLGSIKHLVIMMVSQGQASRLAELRESLEQE